MKNSLKSSRRKFIATATAAGAAIVVNPLLSWGAAETDQRFADNDTPLSIDTHNHIDVPLNAAELPGPKVDLKGELKKSGFSAVCMTFAVDYQQPLMPGDAYNRFIAGLDAMDVMLKSNNIKRSMNLADLRTAHKKNKPTVIQSVEGGHFLEGQLERLAPAYNRGLRVLGLLHDNDASTPLGDVYTKTAQWDGLTKFGAEVIKECNKLGILVDLTHASNKTIDDALKVTTHPVIITHTGLDTQLGQNAQMAKMMRPRLISKEQAKIVADAGGVIGVWTHLADTNLEYAQNIRALVDVVGIDHVCIGTDTKLTPSYRSTSNKQSDNQPNNRQSPPPNDKKRFGERTNEVWANQQVGFRYVLVDALLTVGFQEEEIAKILGGNFCRVFDLATSGH